MKEITSFFLSITIIFSLLNIIGCGSEPQSETDRIKSLLKSSNWKVQSVLVDGVDQTNVYAGLSLNFTDVEFSSTNGRAVWPAIGTWRFSDQSGKAILRNDGLVVTIVDVAEGKLVLSLTWTKTTLGGRLDSVKGTNVFTFSK